MLPFQKTSLWQSSLAPKPDDDQEEARTFLRNTLLDMRERASHLVSFISSDLPGITVHDITHLDAIWETASLIAGDDYPLNPAEALILGGAILLHDAGMCLAAYPNKIQEVKETLQWKDTVTSYLVGIGVDNPTPKQVLSPPQDIHSKAIFEVLRLLHAQQAERLPSLKWPGPGQGEAEYLIQNTEVRTYYGPLIGKIAASHWWQIGELEQKLPATVNAGPSVPSNWTVDPVKLACILRVADAAHVDHRRAPRFLNMLVAPKGLSAIHWNFQSKLGKPSISHDALIYTSGADFDVDEAEAWWLCYDSIGLIDRELREVDILLETLHKPRFRAKRVQAAGSPTNLSNYIGTIRWKPVDTELKVTDVPSLVEMLGGKKLYGNDPTVPIRELIQNASDAIRARRLVEERAQGYGRLKITVRQDADGTWMDFQDNGVGMTKRVLTGALLDFGQSFWRSNAVKEEFPGLIAKGMKPTGRYGIGFFSVFMLGDRVIITTRRFDAAASETYTLDFRGGLAIRPILREPLPKENINEGGTRVSVLFKRDPYEKNGWLLKEDILGRPLPIPLNEIVASVCPNLDIHVEVEEKQQSGDCVQADDWFKLSPIDLIRRLVPSSERRGSDDKRLEIFAQNIRPLFDEFGNCHGRACILPDHILSPQFGVVTVGGLKASDLRNVCGILLGETLTVTRNSALPTVPLNILRLWANEQADIISKSMLPDEEKLQCCAIVIFLGGNISTLPIVRKGNSFLNTEQFKTYISTIDEFAAFDGDSVSYDEDLDDVHPRDFKDHFTASPDLLFISNDRLSVLKVGSLNWPIDLPEWPKDIPKSFARLIGQLVTEVWKDEWTEDIEDMIVGDVDGQDITREVTVFRRGEA